MHSPRRERKRRELVSVKWNYFRILAAISGSVMLITLLGAYALACSYVYLVPSLPSIESMRNVELQVPLRVYTRTGALIAQIGEQRRIPVTYDQIPELVKHAFLAAEDERFFEHHGIDYFGVVRAVLVDVVSGDKSQGASTITMQAARNMFLSLDKTARRKLQETFVTYRMEHEFTKQEIFGLYLNVIFFGQRAYGVAAAAEAFFGKTLDKLDVAEAATIAGLPKAPSRYNPITDPQAATGRRAYVLRRMRELGYIDAATAEAANKEPMEARAHAPLFDVEAPVRRRDGAPRAAPALWPERRERRLQGLHHHRRTAAGGCQPRGAGRTHRVRPPPRLARTGRSRRAARPRGAGLR